MNKFFGQKTDTERVYFNVDDIDVNIISLSNNTEELEITIDGKIKNHYRDGVKMQQTYTVDEVTMSELRTFLSKSLGSGGRMS